MGTPPPVDNALTRAAPRLLETLEALLDRRGRGSSESDELWREAERVISAARAEAAGRASPAPPRTGDFPGKRLNRFNADVAVEIETRRGLPLCKDVMDPVFELCTQLVAYAEQRNSEAEVYSAAVSACATITQVGVHGSADIPYRAPTEQVRQEKEAA